MANETGKFSLTSLALRGLSLFEKLLPAFLIAWNNALRMKARKAEAVSDRVEVELKVNIEEKRIEAANAGKSPKALIDDFLGRR